MSAAPAMRAVVVRDVLDAIWLRHPDCADAIPPALLRAVAEATTGLAWIPAELVLELEATLHERGGAALVERICGAAEWGSNVQGLQRFALEQALKTVRNRPERVFRWVPRIRAYMTRGLGTLRYVPGAGGCTLRLVDAPAFVLEHEGHIAATVGALAGTLRFLRLGGSVHLDREGGAFDLKVAWRSLPPHAFAELVSLADAEPR